MLFVPHHFSRPGSFLCVFWGISPGSYNRLHEGCQREAILNRRSLSFMEVNSTRRHFLSSHFVLELYLRKRRQEPSIVPEGASPKLKPKRVFQNLVSLSFLWAESDLTHSVKTFPGSIIKRDPTQTYKGLLKAETAETFNPSIVKTGRLKSFWRLRGKICLLSLPNVGNCWQP